MKYILFLFFLSGAYANAHMCEMCDTPSHMYLHVQKVKNSEHTFIRIENTWNNQGDILMHDPDCACGHGVIKMYLDTLDYDMNIPIKISEK